MNDSIDATLRAAMHQLRNAGIPEALGDARHLLAHALGVGRDRLILMGPDPMPDDAAGRFAPLLARRMAHEPVTRIIGRRNFWGRDFIVTPDVLDPRPDTETLIAAACDGPAPRRLLDLGTGSGAIVVTLLAEWPQAQGLATDISAPALDVARQNAKVHGVADRLKLIRSDWFAAVSGGFDLILSNPPYIAAPELAALDPEVRLHDPAIALSPGGDGLEPYRIMAAQAAPFLLPGGRIIVEIGWQQGASVTEIFHARGWRDLRLIADMAGRDRVVIARNPADPAEKPRNTG
jgi:release factor glutamine methyltransferase